MLQKGVISHILLFVLLIAGIVIGLYLVQRPQIFRSRANEGSQIVSIMEMKDSNNKDIHCNTSTTPPVCETETQNISIKIKDFDLLLK